MKLILPLHELKYRYNNNYYSPLNRYIDFDTMIELMFLDETTASTFYIWEYIENVDSSVCEDINLVEIIGMMMDMFGSEFDSLTRSFLSIDIFEHKFVSMKDSILIVELTNNPFRK